MTDIKGISPSIVQHRIHLEKGAKPTRDAQRRFNRALNDVVKKEILKLLDNGIIYPISDRLRTRKGQRMQLLITYLES